MKSVKASNHDIRRLSNWEQAQLSEKWPRGRLRPPEEELQVFLAEIVKNNPDSITHKALHGSRLWEWIEGRHFWPTLNHSWSLRTSDTFWGTICGLMRLELSSLCWDVALTKYTSQSHAVEIFTTENLLQLARDPHGEDWFSIRTMTQSTQQKGYKGGTTAARASLESNRKCLVDLTTAVHDALV